MAQLKLTQTKRSDGVVYAVQSRVSEQTNPLLSYPFVITATGQAEAFLRVCTRQEAVDVTYPYNPLIKFYDGAVDVAAVALAGDVLRVYSPPTPWDDAGDPFLDFPVIDVDDSARVVIDMASAFPWSTAGLTWDLLRGDAIISSGTAGATQRSDPELVTFSDSAVTQVFADSTSALQSMALLKSQLDTLVASLNMNPNDFRTATPGNPVVVTIPES